VPDHEDPAAAIACRSLDPLLATLREALAGAGAGHLADDAVTFVAEAYAIGHRDGVRHAVADVAPVAAEHGLRLWLALDVRDDADRRGVPHRVAGRMR
jgi:hypothetical protein